MHIKQNQYVRSFDVDLSDKALTITHSWNDFLLATQMSVRNQNEKISRIAGRHIDRGKGR